MQCCKIFVLLAQMSNTLREVLSLIWDSVDGGSVIERFLLDVSFGAVFRFKVFYVLYGTQSSSLSLSQGQRREYPSVQLFLGLITLRC